MGFKYKKSIKRTYNEQGLIYFACANFTKQPNKVKKKIVKLCVDIAGRDWRALLDVVTGEGALSASIKYYVRESTICKWRKEFYEKF